MQEVDSNTAMVECRIGKSHARELLPALLLSAAGYYCGTRIGFALTFDPLPIPILWPPNAVLVAGLLLSPTKGWWLILLAVLPAHLIAQWQGGIPLGVALGSYLSNCSGAALGAVCIHSLLGQRLRLDCLRHAIVFLLCCALLTPFASSFLDAALVELLGWGKGGFWQLWRLGFFSNVLGMLVIAPVLLGWDSGNWRTAHKTNWARRLEGGLLVLVLSGICSAVLASRSQPLAFNPLPLYAPLPILLWAALRFGPLTTSLALLPIVALAVSAIPIGSGALLGEGFSENVLALQLFLIGVSAPLILLSAAVQEMRKQGMAGDGLARRMSEARFRKIFHLASDAISISRDMQGPIQDVNERWQTLFGYTRGEAIGRTAQELNLYASEKNVATALNQYRQTGSLRDIEMETRDKEGRIRTSLLSGGKIEVGDERCFISMLRDVTEQRESEKEAREHREQLTHLTRVAALGKLSGALAHEINQPLAAILSNAQAARRSMNQKSVNLHELNEILADIVDEDKRAGEVIRRLRAFFMKGEARIEPLEINKLVRDTLEIARGHLMEHKVEVSLATAPAPCVVQGDRVQLQQVVLNLLVNACEAMGSNPPEKRRLELAIDVCREGYVQIVVADTGPGIESDVLDKVFDAFFTTKANGMGFGLSISSAIVAEHGGRIEVANNPGGGAAFHITLPTCVGELS